MEHQRDDWREIWSRPVDGSDFSMIELLKLSGFQGQQAFYSEENFKDFVSSFVAEINASGDDQLFEVGCGPGSFLKVIGDLTKCRVSGLDFSPSLIEVATATLGTDGLVCGPAQELAIHPKFDHVFSHSVFQYLTVAEAEETLSRMLAKARRTVAVLDVPDISLELESEEFRAASLGGWDHYTSLYKDRGLAHTYFHYEFFSSRASEFGFDCRKVALDKGAYPQARFRMDVVMARI